MSKQKYAGRHRALAAPAGQETPSPPTLVEAVETTDTLPIAAPATSAPAADVSGGRQVTHLTGRHRAPSTSSGSSLPRFAGTGLLLPTAAAATLVLTATGAHLGTTTVNLAPSSAQAQAQSAATLADQQETQDVKVNALAAQARSTQQRADRDTQRQKLDAVAQENARRQADEQARAEAAAKAMPITEAPGAASGPSDHDWVPYLDARFTLTSGFGMRWGSLHPGQDFAIPVGTPVKAMTGGTVIFAGWSGGYGNKVEIQYWDGTISWMAHNSVLKVKKGEEVAPGEVVALSGNTGHSTGPHSHLEIHLRGDETNAGAVPPIPWLKAKGIMPGATNAVATGTGATD